MGRNWQTMKLIYLFIYLFMRLVSRHNVNRTKIVQKNRKLVMQILNVFSKKYKLLSVHEKVNNELEIIFFRIKTVLRYLFGIPK